jgi:ubiquinone/menaquinone biosynthesis C-methylase UbiE
MEEPSVKTQMAKIHSFEEGYFATHLIRVGEKLGLFEAIHETEKGLTVSDLASRLGLHEPFLRIWCQTAYHFEILDCDERGRFRLQPFLGDILGDKTSPINYSSAFVFYVDCLREYLESFPEHYVSGKTAENTYSPEISRLNSEMTKNFYMIFIFTVFARNEQLKQMLERGAKFLDIGCGHGIFAIQLAKAFENSVFFGVDPDSHGIEEAKKKVSQWGLEGRVHVHNIGAEDIAYEDEFDMASMLLTLHEIRPGVREAVVENAYRALKDDGKLLILDFPYPCKLEDFRDAKYDLAIIDQFFESTSGFIHMNTHEQDELLERVGFADIQRMPIGQGMFDFICAEKK